MLRRIMVLMMLGCIMVTAYAVGTDEFIIGTKTHYIQLRDQILTNQTQAQVAEDIAGYMEAAHYNCAVEVAPADAIIFKNHGIEPVIDDERVIAPTYFNYVEYQAEYIVDGFMTDDERPASGPDELKWYQVTNNFGQEAGYISDENGSLPFKVISLTESVDDAGYAVDYYRSPWYDEAKGTAEHLYAQIDRREDDDGQYDPNQFFVLSYRMKTDLTEYELSENICRVGAKVLYCRPKPISGYFFEYKTVPITIYRDDQGGYFVDGDWVYIDAEDWGNMDEDDYQYVTFEFQVNYGDIEAQCTDGWEVYIEHRDSFFNLCPVVWYCDNGPLEIDNVGIKGDHMLELEDPGSYPNSTIYDDLTAAFNEGYSRYSALCEISPSQYLAFKEVNRIARENHPEVTLHTSFTNHGMWDAFKYNNHDLSDLHLISKAFRYLGETDNIISQYYPSTCGACWDTDFNQDITHTNEDLQLRLNMMGKMYSEYRKYCDDEQINFYPAVQSWGGILWDDDNPPAWNGILPPSKTQQVLSYMPLCYHVDGIFYYVFETAYNRDDMVSSAASDYPTFDDCELHDDEYRIDPETGERLGDKHYHEALMRCRSLSSGYDPSNQYYAVQAAHAEMQIIGPIIRSLNWSDASEEDSDEDRTFTLMPNPTTCTDLVTDAVSGVTMTAYDPTGIGWHNVGTADEYQEGYQGYVECSIYNDNTSDYFMLVNRRGNFPLKDYSIYHYGDGNPNAYPNGAIISYDNTDEAFVEAEPQVVSLTFTSDFSSDNYHLIDLYDETVYPITNNQENRTATAEIEIGPGEAMLLKLEQFVPTDITGSNQIRNAYIYDDVTVHSGAHLRLLGFVTLGAGVTITVEQGGYLEISGKNYARAGSSIQIDGDGANVLLHDGSLTSSSTQNQGVVCNADAYIGGWNFTIQGFGTGLTINDGSVSLDNVSFIENSMGIVQHSGSVTIDNSSFQDHSRCILVNGGTLDISSTEFSDFSNSAVYPTSAVVVNVTSCQFELSEGSCGIMCEEGQEGSPSVYVSGTVDAPTEFTNGSSATGISARSQGNYSGILDIEYTNFESINIGVILASNLAATINVNHCAFSQCTEGISLTGTAGKAEITNCTFTGGTGTACNSEGINVEYMGFFISDCEFGNLLKGVSCLNTISRSGGDTNNLEPAIARCNFTNNRVALCLLDSSPRIVNSVFHTDDYGFDYSYGIGTLNNSYLDCSYAANNIFDVHWAHIGLDAPGILASNIYLNEGHNDFYENRYDFELGINVSDASATTIFANYNYWSDPSIDPVFVDIQSNGLDISLQPYLIADFRDPNANITSIGNYNNRFEYACQEELDGNLQNALTFFRAITSDRMEEEIKLWEFAVDKSYSLTILLCGDFSELKSLYSSLIGDVPDFMTSEEYKAFEDVLENYIKKCEIQLKNFQAAADIVIERLEDAETAQDTIYTEMEIETIHILSELEGSRAAVVTKHPELKPESLNDYLARMRRHRNDLMVLNGFEDKSQIEEQVPAVPVLSINYPNPFNPTTTICFSVPEESKVEMDIYNIKGQRVKKLVDDDYPRGNHKVEWHGVNETGRQVSSGVYFYRLKVNGKSIGVKKMLMLK